MTEEELYISSELYRLPAPQNTEYLWLTNTKGLGLVSIYKSSTRLSLTLRCTERDGDRIRFAPCTNLLNINISYPNSLAVETVGNVSLRVPTILKLPMSHTYPPRLKILDDVYLDGLMPECLSRNSEDYILEKTDGVIYIMYKGPTTYKRQPVALVGISKDGIVGLTEIER